MTVSLPDPKPLLASIIVPVYNGAKTLDACLTALSAQAVEKDRHEVIVVDDGSTDGSAEVAARYEVTVIRQEHAQAASARNRGAQQAHGEILLLTDADCEPSPDWAEQMLAPFADPEVAGVRGFYRTRQRSVVARFAQAEYEEKYDRLRRADQVDFVDTYSAAYRRDLFLECGGFNPEFLLDEDQELSYRLATMGCKLVSAPAAVVYHRHPTGVWWYARRKLQLGRWKVRVHVRHPSKVLSDSYTPWTQKAQIVLAPLAVGAAVAAALGLISWAVVLILAAAGLVSGIPLMIKAVHQGWQVVMVAPVLVLIRALALGAGIAWGALSEIAAAARPGKKQKGGSAPQPGRYEG